MSTRTVTLISVFLLAVVAWALFSADGFYPVLARWLH
jgi:hypothetical protein